MERGYRFHVVYSPRRGETLVARLRRANYFALHETQGALRGPGLWSLTASRLHRCSEFRMEQKRDKLPGLTSIDFAEPRQDVEATCRKDPFMPDTPNRPRCRRSARPGGSQSSWPYEPVRVGHFRSNRRCRLRHQRLLRYYRARRPLTGPGSLARCATSAAAGRAQASTAGQPRSHDSRRR